MVKDDLIVKVDELTGELEMLREEILSLNVSRTKLRERVSELEDELRKVREANETKAEMGDEEADVPMAQRKRFTRVEMARVLMERNQYKVRFLHFFYLNKHYRWILHTMSKPFISRFYYEIQNCIEMNLVVICQFVTLFVNKLNASKNMLNLWHIKDM